MILVKWGGSLLTNKGSVGGPRFRTRTARRLAAELASTYPEDGVVLVHGAGSFGHPLAKKFGVGKQRLTPPSLHEAVLGLRKQVDAVQRRVTDSLHEAGLAPLAIPAHAVYEGRLRTHAFRAALRGGFVPVTGGDVILDRRLGARILSGDEILFDLARTLRPSRVIFATDVPGVLLEGRLLLELTARGANAVQKRVQQGSDATGGMAGKLDWARRIQALGVEVVILDGRRRDRFRDAVRGRNVVSTRLLPGKGRNGPAA